MASIQNVERQIRRVEGFAVRIRYGSPGPMKGRDVRGDRQSVASYHYQRRRPDGDTVAAWIEGRFRRSYGGFEVDVLDGAGKPVHGGTRLSTVRASYQ
jgi:hypothetical protein